MGSSSHCSSGRLHVSVQVPLQEGERAFGCGEHVQHSSNIYGCGEYIYTYIYGCMIYIHMDVVNMCSTAQINGVSEAMAVCLSFTSALFLSASLHGARS